MKYFNFSFCFYHKRETVTFFFDNACLLFYFSNSKYIGGTYGQSFLPFHVVGCRLNSIVILYCYKSDSYVPV